MRKKTIRLLGAYALFLILSSVASAQNRIERDTSYTPLTTVTSLSTEAILMPSDLTDNEWELLFSSPQLIFDETISKPLTQTTDIVPNTSELFDLHAELIIGKELDAYQTISSNSYYPKVSRCENNQYFAVVRKDDGAHPIHIF